MKRSNYFVFTVASLVISGCRNNPVPWDHFSIHLTSISQAIAQTHFNIDIGKYTEKTWTIKTKQSSAGRMKKYEEADEQVLSPDEVERMYTFVSGFNLDSLAKIGMVPGIQGTHHFMGIKLGSTSSYILRFSTNQEQCADQNKLVSGILNLAYNKIANPEMKIFLENL